MQFSPGCFTLHITDIIFFNVFLKKYFIAQWSFHLFDQRYRNNCEIVLQFVFCLTLNIFFNIMYSCDAKLNFQHHCSSLQCHILLELVMFKSLKLCIEVVILQRLWSYSLTQHEEQGHGGLVLVLLMYKVDVCFEFRLRTSKSVCFHKGTKQTDSVLHLWQLRFI